MDYTWFKSMICVLLSCVSCLDRVNAISWVNGIAECFTPSHMITRETP